MHRRSLLGRLGAVGTAVLAGCASRGDPGEDGASETGTDAPAQDPRMTDVEFTVTGGGPGTQTDEATVTVGDDTVTVEGTIWGANGCKTAELAGVDYDAADELTVAVATTDRADAGEMCTQAIVEIDYRATVAFEGGPPDRVVVTHDHGDGPRRVTTAES